ncbi:MAG: ABC transporter ATP-binding protein [Bacillota bacterium]
MNAVTVVNLTRRFGKFVAVDNISFTVAKGEIFGFLGPNGAGKSTTIRMLCGILAPSSGRGMVAGYDIAAEPDLVKQTIGYMSQKFSLYDDLTVTENLDFYAGIYGLNKAELGRVRGKVLSLVDLQGKERVIAAELSKGWKQRLALACAIVHQPPILFLDEPTSGVDPISRRHFWDLIRTLSARGTTVFVTTHFMDEAEHCNHIAFIAGGRLVRLGTPTELKNDSQTTSLEEAFVYYARENTGGVKP